MLTFIAFALAIAGCINWLLIGLLQYDFVAGIFGYQGSVFSRLIYIVVGAAAIFLVVKLFIDKGSIHVWGAKKKKLLEARAKEGEYTRYEPRTANVEASREERRRRESGYSERADYGRDDYYEDVRRDERASQRRDNSSRSLFDEHLDR